MKHDQLTVPALSDPTVAAIRGVLRRHIPAQINSRVQAVLEDEVFQPRVGLCADDQHRLTYERLRHLVKSLPDGSSMFADPHWLLAVCEQTGVLDPSLCMSAVIHYGVCIGTMISFESGNADAIRFRRALESAELFGVYLVTEMDRANSHLSARTQAVFNPVTREFILHTPDDGALKFANVGISDISKLGIVTAQLMVNGVACGVFPFVLQLSDEQGPCPGVGMSSTAEIPLVPFDYALARFDHVCLPFSSWLSDTASIDAAGNFHEPLEDTDQRLIRTLVAPKNIQAMISMALAAVCRASAVQALIFAARRPTMARIAPDAQLIDISLHRRALLGALATGYVMTCFANDSGEVWVRELLDDGAQNNQATATMTWGPWAPASRRLAVTKALTAWAAEEVTAECRLRCGVAGALTLNGMLGYQGLGHTFNDASGNNLLIVLDAARALADCELTPPVRSAARLDPEAKDSWLYWFNAYEYGHLERLKQGGKTADTLEVWNPMLLAAREAGEAYGLRQALESALAANVGVAHGPAAGILNDLTALFALERVQRKAAWLMGHDLLTPSEYLGLESTLDLISERLAEHVPCLIAAFGFSNHIAHAPMAKHEIDYVSALSSALTWNVG